MHNIVTEPQAEENHMKYTRVHRNCESGLAIIYTYKHAAHRLVQHRWQYSSHLVLHAQL